MALVSKQKKITDITHYVIELVTGFLFGRLCTRISKHSKIRCFVLEVGTKLKIRQKKIYVQRGAKVFKNI